MWLLVFGAGATQAGIGSSWRASSAPFRLEILETGRLVAAEAPLTKPGPSPGTRLGYWLAGGAIHRVTDLRAQRSISGGTAYEVATDEPGRSARVSVPRARSGGARSAPSAAASTVSSSA